MVACLLCSQVFDKMPEREQESGRSVARRLREADQARIRAAQAEEQQQQAQAGLYGN